MPTVDKIIVHLLGVYNMPFFIFVFLYIGIQSLLGSLFCICKSNLFYLRYSNMNKVSGGKLACELTIYLLFHGTGSCVHSCPEIRTRQLALQGKWGKLSLI